MRIKLCQNSGKYVDGAEYLKKDEPLLIELDYNNINSAKTQVTLNNGNSSRVFICEGNTFEIPSDFVKIGILRMKIDFVINNKIVKTYDCEDLIVRETNREINLIPEVEALKGKIQEYKETLDQLIEMVGKLNDLVSGLYGLKVEVKDE